MILCLNQLPLWEITIWNQLIFSLVSLSESVNLELKYFIWVWTGYLREKPWSGTNFIWDFDSELVTFPKNLAHFLYDVSLKRPFSWKIMIWVVFSYNLVSDFFSESALSWEKPNRDRFFAGLSVWISYLRDESRSGINFSKVCESESVISVRNLYLEPILCNRLSLKNIFVKNLDLEQIFWMFSSLN